MVSHSYVGKSKYVAIFKKKKSDLIEWYDFDEYIFIVLLKNKLFFKDNIIYKIENNIFI